MTLSTKLCCIPVHLNISCLNKLTYILNWSMFSIYCTDGLRICLQSLQPELCGDKIRIKRNKIEHSWWFTKTVITGKIPKNTELTFLSNYSSDPTEKTRKTLVREELDLFKEAKIKAAFHKSVLEERQSWKRHDT